MPESLKWKLSQSLEIRWWQRYLKSKSVDNYLSWKKQYWKKLLHNISIQIPAHCDILDVGCGPVGIFTILENQQVTALDPLLDQYLNKLAHINSSWYPNTKFLSQKFENYNPKTPFDFVFCLNAINHFEKLKPSFELLYKSVAKGGKLIISIDAHNHIFLKYIFRAIPGDLLHPHQYDLQEYKKMIKEVGFRIDNTTLYKKEKIFNYYVIIASKT